MTHLSEKLDDTHKKVEEMHAILLQAKGARWVIVGMAGVAGLRLVLLRRCFCEATGVRARTPATAVGPRRNTLSLGYVAPPATREQYHSSDVVALPRRTSLRTQRLCSSLS
jgi:hypothetical protein